LITEFKTNPVISNNSFFEEFEGIIYWLKIYYVRYISL
jgi:hypothetical protein